MKEGEREEDRNWVRERDGEREWGDERRGERYGKGRDRRTGINRETETDLKVNRQRKKETQLYTQMSHRDNYRTKEKQTDTEIQISNPEIRHWLHSVTRRERRRETQQHRLVSVA